jgi:FtsP/CotA-like multicopper oxidase with cupredoxin domain
MYLLFNLVHLHGHQFQIVQLGKGKYDEKIHAKDNGIIANPIRRDVVIIPAEGFAVIHFVADNPGVWLFVHYINLALPH